MIHDHTRKKRGMEILFSMLFAALVVCIAGTSVVDAATINVSVNPTFRVDLINTLKLQEGTGNPTFTRATTATVQDFEGLIKNVKSGEARFVGARRVENLISGNTEGGTSTWTSGGSTAPTLVDDTVNGIRCAKVTFTAASNPGYSGSRIDTGTYSPFSFSSGHQYQLSAYVKVSRVLTGGENIRILWTGSYGIGSSYINAGNSAQFVNGLARVTQTQGVLAVTGTDYPVVTIDSAPGSPVDVWITKVQVEDVTGQANTNPSEYVSVGVLPAPYHGAGVDGVKYFNTKNGNTVTGYVVSEATGAPIKSTTAGVSSVTTDASGPLGYLAEGSRTNLFLWSALFLQGYWGSLSSATTGTATTTSPDGILAGDKLIEDATTNTHYIRQQLTTTAQSYAFSVYAKAGERTRIGLREDQIGRQAVFDLSSGTVVSSGGGSTGSIVAVGNGWYRCTLTGVWGASAVTRNEIYVLPNTATVANTSYAGDGTSGLYIWGGQLEAGAFATSYIPTTSASVTRNVDSLSYATAGNINGIQGSAYAETTTGWPSPAVGAGRILGSYNAADFVWGANATTVGFYDGTAWRTPITYVYSSTVPIRSSGSWSGSTVAVSQNGVIGSGSFDGNLGVGTTFYVGNDSTLGSALSGTLRNLKIWPKVLTNTQLANMTSTGVNSIAKSVVPQTNIKSTNGTGLVGWWKFDEGTGTKVTDGSGLGNTGVINGTASWVQGKIGKALSFNTTNYVIASSSRPFVGNNDYTESAWFKTTMTYGVGTDAPIIWFGGNSSSNVASLGIKNNVLESLHYADDQAFTFAPALNTWYHAVVVYTASNKQVSLYVNGVFQQTLTHTNNLNLSSSGTAVGGDTVGDRKFSGTIDDARIYNRALSPAEITALYKSTAVVMNAPTNTSLTSGLVGLWSFDGKDMNWGTNSALDRSGSGNNGTLVNMSTSTSPVAGKIGQGLKFDGSITQYVNAGTPSSINFGSGAFSIGLWIKAPTQLTTYPAVIEKGTGDFTSCPGTHNGWYLGKVGNNTYDFRLSDNSTTCFDHVNFGNFENLGWTHLVVTVDSGSATSPKIKAYKNGVLFDTVSRTYLGSLDTARNLIFGSWQFAGTFFKGSLDDTRIYNRALSATEVKNLYNLGR